MLSCEAMKNAIVLFAILAFASLALNWVDYSWVGWLPASCMPDDCFCEAHHDGLIRQPINTYSNLAFVLVGLLMLTVARDDWSKGTRHNLMSLHRAYPVIFGLAAIVIGGGSFFYHASLTFIGQWFDVMGMYLFVGFAMVYSFARLRPMRPFYFIVGYLAMNAMLGYLLIVNPAIRRQVFAAMVWTALALEILVWLVDSPKIEKRWLAASVASLALGYAMWMLDETGAWCAPTSWLQGHAVWHLLTALAAGLLFVYYRSEAMRK